MSDGQEVGAFSTGTYRASPLTELRDTFSVTANKSLFESKRRCATPCDVSMDFTRAICVQAVKSHCLCFLTHV